MSAIVSHFFPYKMDSDTGFAPNPYHGVCTLACCSPKTRSGVANAIMKNYMAWKKQNAGVKRSKKSTVSEIRRQNPEFIRDQNFWVFAVGSQKLARGRLIYLMHVTDILTFEEYFTHPAYQVKKPDMNSKDKVISHGDNIYGTDGINTLIPLPSQHSNRDGSINERRLATDLSSRYVLLSDDFYYFGKDAPQMDELIVSRLHRQGHKQCENREETRKRLEELIQDNTLHWEPYHNPATPTPMGG